MITQCLQSIILQYRQMKEIIVKQIKFFKINFSNQKNIKQNRIIQRLKSKTLQKLKGLKNSQKNNIFETNSNQFQNKLKIKKKQQDLINYQYGGVATISTSNPEFYDQQNIQSAKNCEKKISNNVSKSNNISPQKTLYLLYKDQKNNKNSGKMSHIYQRKFLALAKNQQNRFGKTISFIDFDNKIQKNNFTYHKQIRNQKYFFNTLQYKQPSKDQIIQIEKLSTEKTKLFMKTLANFRKNKLDLNLNQNQKIVHSMQISQKKRQCKKSDRIKIRNITTQKDSRHFSNQQGSKIEKNNEKINYRPWSPIKTNPQLGQNNQDEILFQKSKTFNIFINMNQLQ